MSQRTPEEVAWEGIESAPENVVVETKIDDGAGVRNVQPLKRMRRLWWFPDASMYVYYTPTHWRPANADAAAGRGEGV